MGGGHEVVERQTDMFQSEEETKTTERHVGGGGGDTK